MKKHINILLIVFLLGMFVPTSSQAQVNIARIPSDILGVLENVETKVYDSMSMVWDQYKNVKEGALGKIGKLKKMIKDKMDKYIADIKKKANDKKEAMLKKVRKSLKKGVDDEDSKGVADQIEKESFQDKSKGDNIAQVNKINAEFNKNYQRMAALLYAKAFALRYQIEQARKEKKDDADTFVDEMEVAKANQNMTMEVVRKLTDIVTLDAATAELVSYGNIKSLQDLAIDKSEDGGQ